MNEQCFINFGQALEDGSVDHKVLAHFHERADDVDTHGDGTRAVEDTSGHECAVFGKGDRREPGVAVFLGTGRELRPVPVAVGT
jgi:hypothetical protein